MIKNIMRKSLIVIIIVVIIVLVAGAAFLLSKKTNQAGISVPYFHHTQCTDQKCVVAGGLSVNQCSTDSDCITHMQCNNLKKCLAVAGAGKDQCANDSDCGSIGDPQKWCTANNPGMSADAMKYPNGNFSCACYYVDSDGTHSQTPCINSHLQE